jgi:hypothetical protein
MTRKLSSNDRAAVDLLFDQINSSANAGMVSMSTAVPDASIVAVEKVLNVLAVMPAPEPPADLATRTLSRVAAATGSVSAMPATLINRDQPHA